MTPFQQHLEKWRGCTKCELHKVRTTMCFARGDLPCAVLFIGEAPGTVENARGQPFVGPAGRLLDKIVADALQRSQMKLSVCFANLVCCYPREQKKSGENEPPREAIKACSPRLKEFVELAKPRLVVMVGKLSERYAGDAVDFANPLLRSCAIVHPAAILRQSVIKQGMSIQRTVVILQTAFRELARPSSSHPRPRSAQPVAGSYDDEIPF